MTSRGINTTTTVDIISHKRAIAQVNFKIL